MSAAIELTAATIALQFFCQPGAPGRLVQSNKNGRNFFAAACSFSLCKYVFLLIALTLSAGVPVAARAVILVLLALLGLI